MRLECQGCAQQPCVCYSPAQREANARERIADALESIARSLAGGATTIEGGSAHLTTEERDEPHGHDG